MISPLFYEWENARLWTQWNCSLHMQINFLGPVSILLPVFSILKFLSGHTYKGMGSWWLDPLLEWQATLPVHKAIYWNNIAKEQAWMIPLLLVCWTPNSSLFHTKYQGCAKFMGNKSDPSQGTNKKVTQTTPEHSVQTPIFNPGC